MSRFLQTLYYLRHVEPVDGRGHGGAGGGGGHPAGLGGGRPRAAVGAAWAVLEQQGSTRVVIVPAANTSKVSEEVRLHGFSLILVPGNT